MKLNQNSRYKLDPSKFAPDRSLKASRGWHKMDVRWMVTDKTMGSEMTVVGRTILPPGIGAKHALHRHRNAEEWEYIIHGTAIKHVGDDTFIMRADELAFIPRNVYHGLENASENEPLITLWGYSGAASLEKSGYAIPEDDAGKRAVRKKRKAAARVMEKSGKPRTPPSR
jgi:mannose-6-phosphate isomerase-like protein (cupin superfamily)